MNYLYLVRFYLRTIFFPIDKDEFAYIKRYTIYSAQTTKLIKAFVINKFEMTKS